MIIGVIGDAHLGCTDYSQKRRADFSTAFCNAIKACQQQGVEAICLLGDVFDSAATRRNVDAFAELLSEISRPITELKRNKVPLIAIPGNHEYGRGREGGELAVLEHLGFVQVLRCTEVDFGSVRICGIPWQNTPADLPSLVNALRRKSRNGERQILLLHNFIKGGQHIPSEFCEIAPEALHGFDRVFVGHHHIYESIGHCVVPGSTETQNMLDQSDKCVVIYDSDAGTTVSHPLPKTHDVVILKYDVSGLRPNEIIAQLENDLNSRVHSKQPFVYIDIRGKVETNQIINKVELASVLRERDLFDYYIDLHYSTLSKSAAESQRGASIEEILNRAFPEEQLVKAKTYLAYDESERLFTDIRENILSDN